MSGEVVSVPVKVLRDFREFAAEVEQGSLELAKTLAKVREILEGLCAQLLVGVDGLKLLSAMARKQHNVAAALEAGEEIPPGFSDDKVIDVL